MTAAGGVDDVHERIERFGIVVVGRHTQGALTPLERIAVHKSHPAHGRGHRVAVEILDVTHGEVDGLLVDLAVLHVEVDEQLVLVERPVEMHLRQHPAIACRRVRTLVSHLRNPVFVHRQTVHQTVRDERHLLGNDMAVAVAALALVVGAEDEFDDAVVVFHTLFERQVTEQTHLIARRGEVVESLDHIFGQGLFEEGHIVNPSDKAATAKVHRTADTAQQRSGEGLHQLAVHKHRRIVHRAVDRKHHMVPFAVGKAIAYGPLGRIAVQHQPAVLHRQQGAVLVIRPAGREDMSVLSGGLEPQHDRLVIRARAAEQIAVQFQLFVGLQCNGYTLAVIPACSGAIECGAVGSVGQLAAATFIHPVIRHQVALIAGEVLHMGGRNLVLCQCFRPDACLEHIGVQLAAEHKRRRAMKRKVGR